MPRGMVSLEFDDGYRSAYEHALPRLTDRGWRPTMYVVAGEPVARMGGDPAELMTGHEVREWSTTGDVGSHTVTHRDLTELDEDELGAELRDSRRILEELVARPVGLLAMPFGAADDRVIAAARGVYRSTRVLGGLVTIPRSTNPLVAHGRCVRSTTTDGELAKWLALTAVRRGWLTLVWHRVGASAGGEWNVTIDQFDRQLEVIAASGLEVVPTELAVDRIEELRPVPSR